MSTFKNTSNDVLRARVSQNTISVSGALGANEAGQEFNVATDGLTVTLPKIESHNLGMEFLVRNTGGDGGNIITLSPDAADGVNGTIANSAADSVGSGVVNKNFVNTKATANSGDFVQLRAVALTKWFISGGVGIWASQS